MKPTVGPRGCLRRSGVCLITLTLIVLDLLTLAPSTAQYWTLDLDLISRHGSSMCRLMSSLLFTRHARPVIVCAARHGPDLLPGARHRVRD